MKLQATGVSAIITIVTEVYVISIFFILTEKTHVLQVPWMVTTSLLCSPSIPRLTVMSVGNCSGQYIYVYIW